MLQHEDLLDLKRAGETPSGPPTRRAVLSALRQVASEASRPELGATLRNGWTVYQDAGDSLVERIERDGTRTVGRFINRRFTVEEPKRAPRAEMKSRRGEAQSIREAIGAASSFLVAVAGPNVAGKTTFVDRFLQPLGLRVVNPDVIARALFPDAPNEAAYEAARAADAVRIDLLRRGVSFCMETVFSDPTGAKLAFLEEARKRATP